MNKQKEINEMIDRVREGLETNLSPRKYLKKDTVIYLLDLLQEKINEIYEKNRDDYIRW